MRNAWFQSLVSHVYRHEDLVGEATEQCQMNMLYILTWCCMYCIMSVCWTIWTWFEVTYTTAVCQRYRAYYAVCGMLHSYVLTWMRTSPHIMTCKMHYMMGGIVWHCISWLESLINSTVTCTLSNQMHKWGHGTASSNAWTAFDSKR